MAIQIAGTNGVGVAAEDYNDSLRTTTVPRGDGYALALVTPVYGAATIAANSCWFAFRLNPGSSKTAYITQFRLQWCTIVAFTTPLTVGRRMSLYRGSGASASGGTAVTAMAKMSTASSASQFDSASSGDVRYMTTGATGLTVAGITFETQELESFQLTGNGTAGSISNQERRYDSPGSSPIVLAAGQLLGLRNPIAVDTTPFAGTFQMGIDIEWYEL